jgi:hypothetical protein
MDLQQEEELVNKTKTDAQAFRLLSMAKDNSFFSPLIRFLPKILKQSIVILAQ